MGHPGRVIFGVSASWLSLLSIFAAIAFLLPPHDGRRSSGTLLRSGSNPARPELWNPLVTAAPPPLLPPPSPSAQHEEPWVVHASTSKCLKGVDAFTSGGGGVGTVWYGLLFAASGWACRGLVLVCCVRSTRREKVTVMCEWYGCNLPHIVFNKSALTINRITYFEVFLIDQSHLQVTVHTSPVGHNKRL